MVSWPIFSAKVILLIKSAGTVIAMAPFPACARARPRSTGRDKLAFFRNRPCENRPDGMSNSQ
jgi:hypothetical protein